MANRLPWFQRKYRLDLPDEMLGDVLERLRGTPPRVVDRVADVTAEVLTRRVEDAWSIQENVGHLLDLEPLWLGRVEDLLAGRAVLREADLSNRKTHNAGHNSVLVHQLTEGFAAARAALVARCESFGPDDLARVAEHPRLKQPMRLIDLCQFVAEHDDYHLARITELLRGSR